MNELTVIVDTREQRPLMFPKVVVIGGKGRLVKVVSRKLDAGDYALAGAEDVCVVERKGSISEICKNMSCFDSARQNSSFERLAKVRHPVILVEQTLGDLLRPSKYAPNPAESLDALFAMIIAHGILPWLVGNCDLPAKRRIVGELVLRLMVAYKESSGG